ncbi:GyrI-like domain-containing protein [Piscinibacter sp. HJYY11]|uniref:GyrI-like domain-containing protein n=1 Tax=Piscinibacter sp. HJYY11 TaxID=2801333 RepID=UPI00191F3E22|nr:GyrI-like domain-containing protein [Piscinibacter sp. HJYY11]MBL0728850.1 AraC family transcriptional regulator [Piscinibacter sp. HJYY11]
MPLHILERPAFTVMGLHIQTRPMSPDIPALWPRFMSREAEIERPTEQGVSYGVMHSDSPDMSRLDYWAALAVAPSSRTPAGMETLTIPGGHYAVFRYPLSGLGAGFGEIFHTLLPGSDYEQVPGPYFERYNEAFDPGDPNSLVEIYLPVRRKGRPS